MILLIIARDTVFITSVFAFLLLIMFIFGYQSVFSYSQTMAMVNYTLTPTLSSCLDPTETFHANGTINYNGEQLLSTGIWKLDLIEGKLNFFAYFIPALAEDNATELHKYAITNLTSVTPIDPPNICLSKNNTIVISAYANIIVDNSKLKWHDIPMTIGLRSGGNIIQIQIPQNKISYNQFNSSMVGYVHALVDKNHRELRASGESLIPIYTNTIIPSIFDSSLTTLGIVHVNDSQPLFLNSDKKVSGVSNVQLSSYINLSKGTNSENKNPRIAVGENGNIYVVWENSTEDQILFSKSTDGGNTFSHPVTINKEGRGNEPQIAVAANHLYIIWEKRYNMIGFSKSTDGGNTFSNETVWGNESSSDITKAQLDAVGNNVYVILFGSDGQAHPVSFVHSTDGGVTFSHPISLSNKATADTAQMIPQMTVAANDNIYVAWPEADKVVLKKRTDGGVTFGSVPTTVFNACTFDLNIEAANDSVYALCMLKGIDTPEGNIPGTKDYLQYNVIIFSKSIDQASTFSSPVTISKKYNAHTGSPDIVTSGNKSLYIVWPDDANNTYTDIFFTKSTDNGNTFANATNISNDKEDSFSPKIAVLEDNVFIAWQKIVKEKDSQGNDIDNGEITLQKAQTMETHLPMRQT